MLRNGGAELLGEDKEMGHAASGGTDSIIDSELLSFTFKHTDKANRFSCRQTLGVDWNGVCVVVCFSLLRHIKIKL